MQVIYGSSRLPRPGTLLIPHHPAFANYIHKTATQCQGNSVKSLAPDRVACGYLKKG